MSKRRTFNKAAYGKLLARVLPRVIHTAKENERIIAEIERLDTLGRALTVEEEALADLMTLLVRNFEDANYSLDHRTAIKSTNKE